MSTRLGEAFVTLSADPAPLKSGLDKSKSYVSNTATAMEKMLVGSFESAQSKIAGVAGKIGAAVGTYLGARELKDFAMASIVAGTEAERLSSSLKAVYVDSSQAAKEIAFLKDTAKYLGIEYGVLAESYKGISAAAKGTSLEGEGVRDIFYAVAEAGTVLNLSSENIQGTLLALSQMISKETVQAEELRGQMGERLPGAFQIAARAMGMTTSEFDKMLKGGKVLSTEFIPKLAKALHGQNKDSLSGVVDNTTQAVNRLNNEWRALKENMAETGAYKSAVTGLSSIMKWVNEGIEAQRKYAESFKKNFTLQGNQIPGLLNLPTFGEAMTSGYKAGIPNSLKKDSSLNIPSVNDVNDIYAYGGTGSMTGEQNLARFNELLTRSAKIFNETQTALEKYNERVFELNRLQKEGAMDQDTYSKATALAREEYEKGYPVEKLKEELNLAKENSRLKQTYIQQEADALNFAYSQGLKTEQQYFNEKAAIEKRGTDERIRMLQLEQQMADQILKTELLSPSKSPLEKDLLQRQFQSRSQALAAEIASEQSQYQLASQQLVSERIADSERLVSLEVKAMQEILQNSRGSFAERAQLGEEYLEARIKQIGLEMNANIRAGMDKTLAERMAIAQMNEASSKIQSSLAAQQTTVAQVNVSYAQLTGTMESQYRAQIALIQAQKDQKLKEVGGEVTELGRAYKALYDEQMRIAELNRSGSFFQGMADEARIMGNSVATAAMQGRETMRAFQRGIESTADALAEFVVTGKADFSSLAQSIIKDLIKIQIQGMLTKAVGGIFDTLFGGVTSLFGSTASSAVSTSGFALNPTVFPFAAGGDFSANQTMLVGEEGPEIVKFDTPGSIIPNSKIREYGAASGGASRPVNLRVDLRNETGQNMQIEQGETIDRDGTITTSLWLRRIQRDKDYRAQARELLR